MAERDAVVALQPGGGDQVPLHGERQLHAQLTSQRRGPRSGGDQDPLRLHAFAALQLEDGAATRAVVKGRDRGVGSQRGAGRDRASHHAGGRARGIGVARVVLERADADVVEHELRKLAAQVIGSVEVDRDVQLVQATDVVGDLVGVLRRVEVSSPVRR